jgi:hypothetical protein
LGRSKGEEDDGVELELGLEGLVLILHVEEHMLCRLCSCSLTISVPVLIQHHTTHNICTAVTATTHVATVWLTPLRGIGSENRKGITCICVTC